MKWSVQASCALALKSPPFKEEKITLASPTEISDGSKEVTGESSPGIGGSVVEFSPATREARVRFPANAATPLLDKSSQFHLV